VGNAQLNLFEGASKAPRRRKPKTDEQKAQARVRREKWVAKNPNYHRDYSRKWTAKNRERLNERSAKQRRAKYQTDREYRERVSANNKAWRGPRRAYLNEKAKEYTKRYLEADPDYRKKVYASLKRDGIIWRRARDRAQRHGWDFDLTREWIRAQGDHCALTGIKFIPRLTKAWHPHTASIDRIDNSRGYTKDNCRLILLALNRFKGTDEDNVMIEIARALVARANS